MRQACCRVDRSDTAQYRTNGGGSPRGQRPWGPALAGVVLATLATGVPGSRTSDPRVTRLSGSLARQVAGQVLDDYLFTPDGTNVVYRADQEKQGEFHLYTVPTDASSDPVRIDHSLPPGSAFAEFRLSEDGSLLLFRYGTGELFGDPPSLYVSATDASTPPVLLAAAPASLQQYELTSDNGLAVYLVNDSGNPSASGIFAIPTDASTAATTLTTQVPTQFVIDEAGQRAFYIAQKDLFSVPLDGSAPAQRISQDFTGSNTVEGFRVTPAGDRAVYEARELPGRNVYSVPADGSEAPTLLNLAGQSLGAMQDFSISPNGQLVLIVGDVETYLDRELFLVPTDGSSLPTRISPPLVAGGDVNSAVFSPDGLRAVYAADQEVDDVLELYSVPVAGGTPAKLNLPVQPGGAVRLLGFSGRYAVSPDSSRVLIDGYQPGPGTSSLFSAAIDGSATVALTSPLTAPDYLWDFEIDSTSSRAVFRIGQTGAYGLWSAPLAGGTATALVASGDHPEFVLAPGGGDIAFRRPVDSFGSASYELAAISTDGGTEVLLNDSLVTIAVGNVESFLVSPDERWVAYLADEDLPYRQELYCVPITGGPAVKLSPPLDTFGDVRSFEFSPDSNWVVFSAGDSSTGNLLYTSTPDGSSGPVLVSTAQAAGGGISVGAAFGQTNGFTISPDSTWAVYRSDQELFNRDAIWLTRLDGSMTPVELNAPLSGNRDVQPQYEFSPDSQYVVYRADQQVDGRDELFSVPVDLSTPPVKLNSALVIQGDVLWDFEISADSTRVVYRADQDVNNQEELYSVPIDGSAPATKLNPPLDPDEDIFQPLLTGGRVLYQTFSQAEPNRLYTVPITGGSSQELVPGLTTPDSLLDITLAPSGGRVVFVLLDSAQDRTLMSVPADANAAPTVLSAPGGDPVSSYVTSGNGVQILYRTFGAPDAGLFTTPTDGSAAPLAVNFSLPPGRQVVQSSISYDGEQLGILSDRASAGRFHAYRVPRGGAIDPARVSGSLRAAGDVQEVRLSRDGSRVLFLANRNGRNGVELFVARRARATTLQ